jgi:hypothetical protein
MNDRRESVYGVRGEWWETLHLKGRGNFRVWSFPDSARSSFWKSLFEEKVGRSKVEKVEPWELKPKFMQVIFENLARTAKKNYYKNQLVNAF